MEYKDIRPYNDTEVVEAVKRITKNQQFIKGVQYFYPEWSDDEIVAKALTVKKSIDFQLLFMDNAVKRIVKKSSDGLTYSGIENIKKDGAYLYIANHRDIFLDSAIQQIVLVENEMETAQISFGSNLMASDLLIDFGKINKMFTVDRNSDKLEMYKNSMMLSEYLRDTICNKKESIWIAQRNGRTKDGNDITQSGLLKMLNMTGSKDFVESFSELNIVPLTISYEYEPCDIQKATELFHSSKEPYIKKPGEDMQSILSGVVEHKGRIHLSFGTQIKDELECLNEIKNNNLKIDTLAKIVNRRVYTEYKLWKTNYIAADMINDSTKYSTEYTTQDKENFMAYIDKKLPRNTDYYEEILKIFLNIYGVPVFNAERCKIC